ncbi:RWD domain-containing protein 1-like [Sycon ciliatum]|uniref:RWD domain-containing protein 1-like n=1 Tax=Sycon ciliatum TaxID=27933 RepID=UPI0020A86CE8|eukprot:scpid79558/ scgid23603/ RWD domain-containing protein 1; DRG family-regulatory protein 2; IH1
MTDYAEEQANEIEALQSIYPNEFEELGQSPWRFLVDVQPEASDDIDEDERCSVRLKFKLGDTYPDEVAQYSIASSENLEDSECEEMMQLLGEEAEASVGMVMIFTLVSAAQEFLNRQQDAVKKRRDDEEKAREEAERKKAEQPQFFGTPVTCEAFYKWKAKFEAETQGSQTSKADPAKKRPTGKELFERDASLSQSDMQLLEYDEDLAETQESSDVAASADVDVDESLFEDLEDLGFDADLDIT